MANGVAFPMADPLLPNRDGGFALFQPSAFPDGEWTPDLAASAMTPNIMAQIKIGDFTIPAPDPATAGDIKAILRKSRRHLSTRAAEISAQSGAFEQYFAALLTVSSYSKPNTAILISLGRSIGGLIGMHFKWQYKRPRPVQVFPGLMPFLPTPPHASYPSNHATQSYVIAGLLAHALGTDGAAMAQYLDALAERIATNREVAGLHYRSDTTAGMTLGAEIVEQLAAIAPVQALINDASKELSDFHTVTDQLSLSEIIYQLNMTGGTHNV